MTGPVRFYNGQIFQVSATANATTTSTTDVLLTGMTITPGAGSYLVWFSGSGNADSASSGTIESLFISIYVGPAATPTQQAHTERRYDQEESVDNSAGVPFATQAYITGVGATDVIQIRWRRSAANLTTNATFHQRTLTIMNIQ
jgi:hypothetical protein